MSLVLFSIALTFPSSEKFSNQTTPKYLVTFHWTPFIIPHFKAIGNCKFSIQCCSYGVATLCDV